MYRVGMFCNVASGTNCERLKKKSGVQQHGENESEAKARIPSAQNICSSAFMSEIVAMVGAVVDANMIHFSLTPTASQ